LQLSEDYMRKEINWEKQAKRDFDPVQIWNDAMNSVRSAEVHQEQNRRKCTASLLAKNPNHFRDLALKSAQKRREAKEGIQDVA
jgi:hypothetical protein